MVEAVQPNGFETNAGSFRGGKNHGATPDAVKAGGLQAGFRKFMGERGGKAAKPKADAVEIVLPTAERMTKSDMPGKTVGGTFRSVEAIERLFLAGKLDSDPSVNLGMYEAAQKLYGHFREAGLSGIAAQDLSRVSGTATTASASFPHNDRIMHNRQCFREAQSVMGWHIDAPHRGAGRLVVDVVCYDRPVKEAAQLHIPAGRAEVVLAAGMDRLREGLFALATHWRTFGKTQASRIRTSTDMESGESHYER